MILAVMALGLFVSACGVVTSHTSSVSHSTVTLSCRLPIGSQGGEFGGFVSFPQATFERGSNSSLTYDVAHQRWLPVGRQCCRLMGGPTSIRRTRRCQLALRSTSWTSRTARIG